MLGGWQGPIAQFDSTVTEWFHARATLRGISVSEAISHLGAPVFILILGAVGAGLFALRRRRFEMAVWIAGIGCGTLLSEALKALVRRPRPVTAPDPLSFSFPSGHAMVSLVGYGLLVYFVLQYARLRATRITAGIAAGILVLAIGASRLYPGLHYFSDVIGGWLIGALWLGACIAVLESRRRHPRAEVPPLIGHRTSGPRPRAR